MYEYSGGEGGGVFTPDGTQTIEFKKNGVCTTSNNGKKQSKKKFTLSENSTQYGNMTIYTITYEKTGVILNHKRSKSEQTIMFFGQDTLVLSDPCCDMYQYNYVKKYWAIQWVRSKF